MKVRASFQSILLVCFLASTPLHANFLTCEGLTAWIGGLPVKEKKGEGTGIVWPKSIIPEEVVPRALMGEVEDHWRAGHSGTFKGKGDLDLQYKSFEVPDERAAIIIPPGHRTDMHEYSEPVYELGKEGYSLYTFDHRGQGSSPRLGKTSGVAHVDSFNDYVGDLETFINEVVKKKPHDRVYILGPSMGGLISTHLVLQNPDAADAIVAIAPAFGVNLKGIPKNVARVLLNSRIAMGMEKAYAPFVGDRTIYQWCKEAACFDTPHRMMVEVNKAIYANREIMGGPSNRLTLELVSFSDAARNRAGDVKTPMLVFKAGADDVIPGRDIEKFIQDGSSVSTMTLNGANHVLLLEGDKIRNAMMSDMYRFLIHPERLDVVPRGDEIERMLKDTDRYLARGEVALARYAIDEGLRTQEWQKSRFRDSAKPELDSALSEKSNEVWSKLASATPGEKGLYMFLNYRRQQELQTLYGSTTP